MEQQQREQIEQTSGVLQGAQEVAPQPQTPHKESIVREDNVFLPKRIFRLRAYAYYNISWLATHDIMSEVIAAEQAVELLGRGLLVPTGDR